MDASNRQVDDKKRRLRTDSKHLRLDRKVKDGNQKTTFTEKLMLSGILWSIEASSCFEQLYLMPLQLTLGVPLSLVSITGAIAGPSSVLLLPLIGWLVDKGSNPWRRKTSALVFAFSITASGLLCLLTANMLHLNYLAQYSPAEGVSTDSSISREEPVSLSATTQLLFHNSSDGAMTGTGCENETEFLKKMADSGVVEGFDERTGLTKQSTEVSFKAGLGILGIILLDIGFDATNAFAKTFVLASSPRSEHTSLLAIGLIMASGGGMVTAVLGLVDFTSILGFSYLEGGRISIQTSTQAVIVLLSILLYLSVSILSGRRLVARTYQTNKIYPTDNSDIQVSSHFSHSHHDPSHSDNLATDTMEISVRSYSGKGPVSIERSSLSISEEPQYVLVQSGEEFSSERTPLLFKKDDAIFSSAEKMNQSCVISVSPLQNSDHYRGTGSHQRKASSLKKGTSQDLTALHAMEGREQRGCCCKLGFKAKLAFMAISIYFSAAQINTYTLTVSDYVGKAIYGGDPAAPPESESLARYQNATKMSSLGFLTYYGSYLLISTVHTRLLAFLGFRVEFVLAQLLMAGSTVVLAMTARLEAFFALSVISGYQRACFYVVPFAVVNDIVQDMALSTGKSNVGLAITAVSASIPLSFCTMFAWLGAAEEATGIVSFPLWVSATCGCLSAVWFLALGKV